MKSATELPYLRTYVCAYYSVADGCHHSRKLRFRFSALLEVELSSKAPTHAFEEQLNFHAMQQRMVLCKIRYHTVFHSEFELPYVLYLLLSVVARLLHSAQFLEVTHRWSEHEVAKDALTHLVLQVQVARKGCKHQFSTYLGAFHDVMTLLTSTKNVAHPTYFKVPRVVLGWVLCTCTLPGYAYYQCSTSVLSSCHTYGLRYLAACFRTYVISCLRIYCFKW